MPKSLLLSNSLSETTSSKKMADQFLLYIIFLSVELNYTQQKFILWQLLGYYPAQMAVDHQTISKQAVFTDVFLRNSSSYSPVTWHCVRFPV